MAEVILEFDTALGAPDGTSYHARVCGREAYDGTSRWEGWIEFVPERGGRVLRSRRETTQPNRADLEYWATGLTPVYLEGALERAQDLPRVTVSAPIAAPAFDGPAPDFAPSDGPGASAILDPFSVYQKGESLLRNQLGAMSDWHLVIIVLAYELSEEPAAALERKSSGALVDLIVSAVARRSGSRA
jgi:hypothetical protein